MEGQRRFALTGLTWPGNDPHVLHGAAAEYEADMQLADSRRGFAGSCRPAPVEVPGAHELAEQRQRFTRLSSGPLACNTEARPPAGLEAKSDAIRPNFRPVG